MNESDWKYMRDKKKTLLDRLCNRILDDLHNQTGVAARQPDVHQQYLKVYRLIKKWDKVVADCFDGWCRSELFFFKILFLIKHQVITDAEVDQLSEETKEQIKSYFLK